MTVKYRICDNKKKTVINKLLICDEKTFEIDRQLAPTGMKQTDLVVEIDGNQYKFTSEQFINLIIKNGKH